MESKGISIKGNKVITDFNTIDLIRDLNENTRIIVLIGDEDTLSLSNVLSEHAILSSHLEDFNCHHINEEKLLAEIKNLLHPENKNESRGENEIEKCSVKRMVVKIKLEKVDKKKDYAYEERENIFEHELTAITMINSIEEVVENNTAAIIADINSFFYLKKNYIMLKEQKNTPLTYYVTKEQEKEANRIWNEYINELEDIGDSTSNTVVPFQNKKVKDITEEIAEDLELIFKINDDKKE